VLDDRAVGFRGYATKALLYLVMIFLSLLFLFPFYWLFASSLKADQDIFRIPPVWWPSTPQFGNYIRAVTLFPFPTYLKNTLVICISTMIGTILSCSLCAYSLGCVDWPGRNIIFIIIIAIMLMPYTVIMVPVFIIFCRLGWVGTPWPLIVPAFLATNSFYIFLLRQFFRTLPVELFDAARIDGASDLYIYGRIVMPLSRTALTVVALFQFMGAWNDFMGPLIYLSSADQYTVAVGLHHALLTRFADWSGLMAASLLATLPLIFLYFFMQRNFVTGITLTGLNV